MRPSRPGSAPVWLAAFAAALSGLAGIETARADWVWRPEVGWSDPNKPPRDTPTLRYQHALAMATQGQGKSAAKELERLVKEYPRAKWIEDARFNVGEAYYLAGDYRRSAKAFERYWKDYPLGRRSEQVLRRLLSMGTELAEKRGRTEAGVDLLEKVIEFGPTSDLADDASAAIGDAYFHGGHYDEAVDAYRELEARFPRSEWVQAVPFKIGLCYMHKAMQIDVNPEAYARAQEAFEKYIETYPTGQRIAEAKDYMERAQALQARAEYLVATFYVRIDEPRAAAVYLRSVVRSFPETDHARQAEALLERLAQQGVTR